MIMKKHDCVFGFKLNCGTRNAVIGKKITTVNGLFKTCIILSFWFAELRGIPRQSSIGFLTLLEAHRYCEVNWKYSISIVFLFLFNQPSNKLYSGNYAAM